MKGAKTIIRTGDIQKAMSDRFAEPQWAIMWEVGEGTGSMSGRYADAVMMSLWPSRGLELHGVEIKVSRADWKREAADPTKAEAIAKFCDRWWIHTPPGIVDDLSDLPPAWGLREWNGKNWKTVREAEKTAVEPISRAFLAALLRRADNSMKRMIKEATQEARQAAGDEAERMRQGFAKRVEDAVERRTRDLRAAKDNVAAFEAAFGKGAATRWDCHPERWGAAALALDNAFCEYKGLKGLAQRLREAADAVESLQAEVLGVS